MRLDQNMRSDTGQIEAAGRPLKCVSSKNEDCYCDLEKNRDILKIKENATKSHISNVKSFQKWKNLYDIFCVTALRTYTNYVNRFNKNNLFANTENWGFFFDHLRQ